MATISKKAKAQQAESGHEEVDAAQAKAAEKIVYLRLVNGCSTYVTPEREIFYAKDSNSESPRIYEVSYTDMMRLMGYKDDYGRKFFKQVVAPEDGKVAKPDDLRKAKIDETPQLRERDEEFHQEGGELDTGAMALRDKDGNAVGVTV